MSESPEKRCAFARAIREVIDHHASVLPPQTLCEVLDEVGAEYAPAEPSFGLTFEARQWRIVGNFERAGILAREIEEVLSLQAICIHRQEYEPAPDVMSMIDIDVDIHGTTATTLEGRVVHVSPGQVAIQVLDLNASESEALRELPNRMRAGEFEPAPRQDDVEAPMPSRDSASMTPEPPGSQQKTERSMPAGQVTPERLRAGVSPRQWDLCERSIRAVLCDIAQEQGEGILELHDASSNDGTLLRLTLREGCIVAITRAPARPEDSLESLLRGAGKLTDEQVVRAREVASERQIGIADALLDLRMMEYGALRLAMKTRLMYMARQIWELPWSHARFFEVETTAVRTLAAPVPLYRHIFSVVQKRYTASGHARSGQLRERFERSRHRLARAVDAQAWGLSRQQERFMEVCLDEFRQLDELLLISPLGNLDTLIILAVLDDMGLLESCVIDGWSHRYTRQHDQLKLIRKKLALEDHFEVLGLHWSAYGEEVEQAYHELMQQYRAEHFSAVEEAEDTLGLMRERLDEAYQALHRAHRRRAYRDERISDFELRSSAEMFRRQANAAQMRREIDAAIDFNRRVLELLPRDAAARDALRLLKEAQRRAEEAREKTT